MDIRPATTTDIPSIQTIAEHSWEKDYDVLTRETARETVAEWYSEDRLRTDIESDTSLVLVADEEGIVGFSHSAWSDEENTDLEEENTKPDVGTILRLYVDPDNRRTGIGSQLLEETRTALTEHDLGQIEAMVLDANEPGNDFYRAAGFKRIETGETVIGGETYPENIYRDTANKNI
jgi:ribosomal protein S18 acetylase RimI-like enzyme